MVAPARTSSRCAAEITTRRSRFASAGGFACEACGGGAGEAGICPGSCEAWAGAEQPPARAARETPISASSSTMRFLHELREHSAGRGWVHEGDACVVRAGARLFVDQPQAARLQRCERALQVVDLVREVVQAGSALREEVRDRR